MSPPWTPLFPKTPWIRVILAIKSLKPKRNNLRHPLPRLRVPPKNNTRATIKRVTIKVQNDSMILSLRATRR